MDNSSNPPTPTNRYSDSPDELPVIVRRSEILNLMVMDRGTMQEVGRVERLWMYPQAHRILGVICKGGGLLSKQRWAYKLPQIDSLNQSNIWVEGPSSNPSPEQLRQLQTLIDHEIWVDGGDRLGVIVDCLFNRKTGQITQYLFVNNRLRQLIDASNPLRPEEILSFGNNRVLVSPQAMTRLRRERPNLRQTFSQMKDQARAEYEQAANQTQERVRNWGEEAKTARERLAEQATQLKQQAADRAKALQEQASQDILPQIAEQAQELTQRAGEQYQTVQRRAQDFVEELPPLEQLGEEMRGYGRDRNTENRTRDSNSPSYTNDDSYASNEPDGYRQSRRSRYRRDDRLEERPGDRGFRDQRSDQRPYREADEPSETTWVDEVEAVFPTHPAQEHRDQSAPIPTEPKQAQYRDGFDSAYGSARSDWDAPPHPDAPRPDVAFNSPPSEPPAPNAPPSRDNPWGYADSATDSDWDDLEFAQEPAAAAAEEPLPIPEPPVVAPEDLEDDDPWV